MEETGDIVGKDKSGIGKIWVTASALLFCDLSKVTKHLKDSIYTFVE